VVATVANAQTITRRARLGNDTEGLTFIASGPKSNSLIVLDGYSLLRFAGEANGNGGYKLFADLKGTGTIAGPRGVASVTAENIFVFNDPTQPTRLFAVDSKGNPLPARTVTYPTADIPNGTEGLYYLPPDSPHFPDRILMMAMYPDQATRIEVMRRDGFVESEIVLASPLGDSYLLTVAPKGSDRLVICDGFQNWEVDYSGNLLAGPIVSEVGEGLLELPSLRLAVVSHDAGLLKFMDESYNLLPADTRSYKIGFGLSSLRGMSWNTDTNSLAAVAGSDTEGVYNLATTLDSASPIFTVDPNSHTPTAIAYLPAEHKFAVNDRNVRVLNIFDATGNLLETIQLPKRANGLTYIAATNQFAVRYAGDPRTIHILNRDGSPARDIDLSALSIASGGLLTYFNPSHPSGGEFIVNDVNSFTLFVVDFNGNLISSFNHQQKLGVLRPGGLTAILSGPDAGKFAIAETDSSEAVVFSMN
jgi:hypothetical protein